MGTDDILVVGYGNMGRALAEGFMSRVPDARVTAVDPGHASSGQEGAGTGGTTFHRSIDDVRHLSPALLILATKPDVVASLLPRIAGEPLGRGLVVSIAAGVGAGPLRRDLPDARVVRAMPNTPALVGAGTTVLWRSAEVTAEDVGRCEKVFGAVGAVHWVEDEELVDAATAVSGSGPAYFFAFVEALARAASDVGLPAGLAADLARTTMTGAAAMLDGATARGPAALKVSVRSPAGTTDAALKVFERDGSLDDLVGRAVRAARDRAVELRGS